MSAVALRIDSFFSPHTDRGISDDAAVLLTRIKEVGKDISDTETLGKNYREALNALRACYNDCLTEDWAGEGAEPVMLADLLAAERFLRTLPTLLPRPEVSVDPDGEFAFEWYNSDRDVLSVSIGRQGKISYAARFGKNRTHGTEYFGDELPSVITANLERLFS
jgi:hypothetical protein